MAPKNDRKLSGVRGASKLKRAGEGWAYVGIVDNKHHHGWIPQECMQVAVRPPEHRERGRTFRVRESWAPQRHGEVDGYLRVNEGDIVEVLETLEAGQNSWVWVRNTASGRDGDVPEHCLD
ncbi:unnamed protein product [Symbiodinium natans]|uniref:SH3 domain-containing protein n=1 Tax=Symbiodinium natans TaxID=878477 RepID=A0A812LQ63_9DINO|nr:unnamed protein product [Symbiodinium natans]